MPRTIVDQDFLLGEDKLGKYDLAVDVEVYIKNVQGFEGEGDFLSKFGLEVRDQITFTIARKRFDQIKTEKVLTENGWNLQIEEANTGAWSNTEGFLTEGTIANGYSITSSRPLEGDLIFFPLNNKLYEIKFVEHENIFYQFGKLYTYDLTCELFDRDSRLDTGNTIIDSIELEYSQDVLFYQLLTEDGFVLCNEDGGSLLTEYRIEDTVPVANNEYIQQQQYDFIDWSETNPWSETGIF